MALRPKVFLDSNVVLYLLSADVRKADIAENLLVQRPTVSVQVLSEAVNVCHKKLKMPWIEIHALIDAVKRHCLVEPLVLQVHQAAVAVAQRYQVSFYDAQIIASALHSDCDVLMSEDLHDGLHVQQLRVQNPFSG